MTPEERMRSISLQAILELMTDLHRKRLLLGACDEDAQEFRAALAQRLRALRSELGKSAALPPTQGAIFQAEWARVSQEVLAQLAADPTQAELNDLGPIWGAAHPRPPPTPD